MRRPPRYLVFSDVDETLIDCKSMFDFQRFQLIRRHGERGRLLAESRRRQVQLDADTGVPREEINRRYYRQYAGEPADALMLLGRLWFAAARAEPGFFVPGTLEALRQHRSAGAEIVLVSGSFPPCLAPIAQYLGAARVLCTDPEVREGRLTGEIGEPVIGEGKRAVVRRLLAEHPRVDPQDCFAYGDHPSDIPMLDCVGHPVAVGGHPELLRYVAHRGTRTPSAPALAPAAG